MYLTAYSAANDSMPYGQGMSTIPGTNDDWNGTSTDGAQQWCDGALWQYVNGTAITMYMCLDSSPGVAVWVVLVTGTK